MDSLEFIQRYPELIDELRQVTDSKWLYLLDEMSLQDPHDLVRPETWFPDENMARGYVLSLFMRKVRAVQKG